ncbi:ABC transporter ATP-binding protein [Lactiplantibacillus mudanjiangensis]|uniref:ABC transporter domain-containing protein n=1 Tax=Lactiplantibacillus mudanjiangensis TaxID=1296538 RepID=A0A660DZI0_9LACO|nr:ABC transporter ATP-binding protein [Lactiplantibacillus mudanjiangensis]VDG24771.1 hypothetical protein [Lactobacillus koreensis] [Lactiplantibacillus mudanjiangensis]VDG28480.1 hypothetical protein [Lactobacillus koreensis] [Lactiplantibacillus mudanjiangensis]VDG32242.1 hypothetical protein [Lactobacillus koreensis] [Lactiplantibacillus mudanjiangensis]
MQNEPLVQIKHLSKRFGRKVILHDVSLTLPMGHIVGLIGPNGAGKTTLMKIMIGLLNGTTGQVILAGKNVTAQQHQFIQESAGALIESPALYPFLTGWQHLQLYGSAAESQTIVDTMGMASYIQRRARDYSLGMKQKLGIAMALVKRPRLVILDEPMNGLDPQSVQAFRQLIQHLAQAGTTFLISSHQISELEKILDDVIVIDQGQVLLQASLAQIRQDRPTEIVVKTTDDRRARQLLLTRQVTLVAGADVRFQPTAYGQLNDILRILVNANLPILTVHESQPDLETTVLTLLTHHEEENNYD